MKSVCPRKNGLWFRRGDGFSSHRGKAVHRLLAHTVGPLAVSQSHTVCLFTGSVKLSEVRSDYWKVEGGHGSNHCREEGYFSSTVISTNISGVE